MRKDILFDKEGNLLGVDYSDDQHKEDILIQSKGWNKFYPYIGVGVFGYLEDDDIRDLPFKITGNLELDGYIVTDIDLNNFLATKQINITTENDY